MSFLSRATVALWRAISSRIGGVGVGRGGLLDMAGWGDRATLYARSRLEPKLGR